MGLIKNEHGVYHVRRKVPKALEEATATVMGVSKTRVSWLKETLGTKDEKQAKVRAKPVMMKFDGILAKAEALLVEHPVRTELTEAEIRPPPVTKTRVEWAQVYEPLAGWNLNRVTYEQWDASTQTRTHPTFNLRAMIDDYDQQASQILQNVLSTMRSRWP